jgi:hypothetical protein
MSSIKSKWAVFVFAASFAILQVLQPFIHAHIDAEHPIQITGFHLGGEHEEVFNLEHLDDHAVSDYPHASYTVSVDSGIKQDADGTFLTNVILALIFSFCCVLALQAVHILNYAFLLVPKESLRRWLPPSHAPPQI